MLPLAVLSASRNLRSDNPQALSRFRIPTSWGYENIPKINQAGPLHWHLLAGAMACEAGASTTSAQSPIDVTSDAVVPAAWLPILKLHGGYSLSSEADGYSSDMETMKAFGDGRAPVWVNNGHTVELGPNHLSPREPKAGYIEHRQRRLKGYSATLKVDEVAAASAAQDQAKLLSSDPDSKTPVLKEEHYQAQQQEVNPDVGSIDIGGLSALNFQGPTLAANSVDEGWNETETVYDLLQLHLHWGRNKNEGSEHHIAGIAHPLELHLVHTQRGNPYPTRSPGGLLAVSVMFEIGKPNAVLAHMLNAIQENKFGRYGSSIPAARTFDVRALLPEGFESNYLTYKGSLTTPGCFQSVNWIIAGKTLTVSKEQLKTLRSVESLKTGEPLTNNFRPVQPKNGRVIWMKGARTFDTLAANANQESGSGDHDEDKTAAPP